MHTCTAEARTTYRDYVTNLDKLAVYVDNKGGKEPYDEQANMCGFVSRLNDALFKPRLHLQCVRPLSGRYVYIEAWGVPNRWSRLFSVVLCEVMVYEWPLWPHLTVSLGSSYNYNMSAHWSSMNSVTLPHRVIRLLLHLQCIRPLVQSTLNYWIKKIVSNY